MQLITDWWGIVIGAENEGDDKILKQLFDSLPDDGALECYGTGEIELTEGDHKSHFCHLTEFDKSVTSSLKIDR